MSRAVRSSDRTETMTHEDQADDGADAVAKFRKLLGRRLPQRIQARIDSPAGMAGLCAVEARLADCWAVDVSKEFVWLTRSPAAPHDRLELRAFADGEVICEAVFQLTM
jgi:hypothetical protein